MGLLDDVIGAVTGAASGNNEGGVQGMLTGALQGSSLGGLTGILSHLSGSGLGDVVSSWQSGGGQGLPISVDQLKAALTPDHIQEIASALNLSPDGALAHLAEQLPALAGKGQA